MDRDGGIGKYSDPFRVIGARSRFAIGRRKV